MKKQLFLFAFIFCAFTSTQFVSAQDNSATISVQKDMSAEKQAKTIINLFGREDRLTKTQSDQILGLFSDLEEKIKVINNIKDKSEKLQKTEKIQTYIDYKLEGILSESQYEIYLDKMVKN